MLMCSLRPAPDRLDRQAFIQGYSIAPSFWEGQGARTRSGAQVPLQDCCTGHSRLAPCVPTPVTALPLETGHGS